MRFSQRMGYVPVRVEIQLDSMDRALRVGLLNVFHKEVTERARSKTIFLSGSLLKDFIANLWGNFLKRPIDKMPSLYNDALSIPRDIIDSGQWYEVYDLIEFAVEHLPSPLGHQLETELNPVLERELSGYRFIGGNFSPITNQLEIESIESALNGQETLKSTRAHLQLALEMLSSRSSPDYRNSIKESISAVEAMARDITGNPRATLGNALTEIEKSGHMHQALKKGLTSLYGYTSDAAGIRHALMDESQLTANDARFMLVACSAFINYMMSKNLDA